MSNQSRSEIRWMISFVTVDLTFWLVTLGGCTVRIDGCGVAVGAATVGFYTPFWFWLNWMNLEIKGVEMQIVAIASIGSLCHLCIGWLIGKMLRNHPFKWYVSIPASFVCTIMIVIIGNMLGRTIGIYK